MTNLMKSQDIFFYYDGMKDTSEFYSLRSKKGSHCIVQFAARRWIGTPIPTGLSARHDAG